MNNTADMFDFLQGIFMIGNCLLAMLGFAILTGVRVEGVKYMACFFIVMGVYSNVPQGVAWNGNNIGGSVKRGVGIAMHVGFVSLWTFSHRSR